MQREEMSVGEFAVCGIVGGGGWVRVVVRLQGRRENTFFSFPVSCLEKKWNESGIVG